MMTHLRSLIFYILFILLVPPSASLLWFLPTKGKYSRYGLMRTFGRILNTLLTCICGVRFKVEVQGQFQGKCPVLMIANHTGPWETLALAPFLKTDFVYVIKKELIHWKYSFFALGVRTLKCIPISREKNAGDFKHIVDMAQLHFKEQRNVLIFPEGSRYPVEHCLEMEASGFLMAKKLKCAVLPIFIDSQAWGLGRIIKDFGVIRKGAIKVTVGQLMSTEEIKSLSAKELNSRLMKFYTTELSRRE